MTMPTYPLLQVLQVKVRRVEQQEKVVAEKKEVLEEEKRKLQEKEKARDKVLNHHNDKLQQLRDELDKETTTDKIKQMKLYIKEVKIKLEAEEKKVKEQLEQVEVAKKDLEAAQEELRRRRVDVDKLKTHQIDWEKEMRKELQIIAGREEDELGQIIFAKNQRER
ncbi:MAG: type III secretion T3S chaperone [Chlamydiota bacterium]|nr:type III secretion T3S chaperone [Chlamydiota bacterium]